MTNKDLQELLKQYPDDMALKFIPNGTIAKHPRDKYLDLSKEFVLLTSDTAYIDENADAATWDAESGKIELGTGTKFLLFNPVIY